MPKPARPEDADPPAPAMGKLTISRQRCRVSEEKQAMEGLVGHELLSERVRAIKPSGIRRFFDIAATMKDVLSLGIGEPDFVTPEHIRQAGIRAIEAGETHYTSNYGTVELREAIAANLGRRYGVAYDPRAEIM